jgi:hypothetical protein
VIAFPADKIERLLGHLDGVCTVFVKALAAEMAHNGVTL